MSQIQPNVNLTCSLSYSQIFFFGNLSSALHFLILYIFAVGEGGLLAIWNDCEKTKAQVCAYAVEVKQLCFFVFMFSGYYAEQNAIVVFAACFLPDSNCDNYNYVMENLFLWVKLHYQISVDM